MGNTDLNSSAIPSEKEFDDDELEDIMSEIESLERDFSNDLSGDADGEAKEEAKEETREEGKEEAKEETREEVREQAQPRPQPHAQLQSHENTQVINNVSSLRRPSPSPPPPSRPRSFRSGSKGVGNCGVMNFSGIGHMEEFQLNFSIGKEKAILLVKDHLIVQVAGVEITIDKNRGCFIEAPGGVQFSVPIEGLEGGPH